MLLKHLVYGVCDPEANYEMNKRILLRKSETNIFEWFYLFALLKNTMLCSTTKMTFRLNGERMVLL